MFLEYEIIDAPSIWQKVIARCAHLRPNLYAYDCNRKRLYEELTRYGYHCVYPKGAFYLFVKSPYGTSKEFSDKAKQHDLLIVPGDDFGCPEYFRPSLQNEVPQAAFSAWISLLYFLRRKSR